MWCLLIYEKGYSLGIQVETNLSEHWVVVCIAGANPARPCCDVESCSMYSEMAKTYCLRDECITEHLHCVWIQTCRKGRSLMVISAYLRQFRSQDIGIQHPQDPDSIPRHDAFPKTRSENFLYLITGSLTWEKGLTSCCFYCIVTTSVRTDRCLRCEVPHSHCFTTASEMWRCYEHPDSPTKLFSSLGPKARRRRASLFIEFYP